MKSNSNSLFIVSLLVSLSSNAAAQINDPEVQSATLPSEKSWFETQAELRKKKREAAIQYQKNTLFCAAPTYTKKDGKFVVLHEGKCEKGGFSNEPSKTSLSDRKSKQ